MAELNVILLRSRGTVFPDHKAICDKSSQEWTLKTLRLPAHGKDNNSIITWTQEYAKHENMAVNTSSNRENVQNNKNIIRKDFSIF